MKKFFINIIANYQESMSNVKTTIPANESKNKIKIKSSADANLEKAMCDIYLIL